MSPKKVKYKLLSSYGKVKAISDVLSALKMKKIISKIEGNILEQY